MVKLAGGKPVFLHAGADADYKIAPEQLAAAVTPRTAMLIFNSPSNPTGMVYSEAEIRALAAALESHPRVVVLSDEIYEKLIYDGARHFSFAAASPAIEARTLTVNGMSKAYAMTGWRIGYCAGPRPIVAAMERLQSHSTSNATSFCQSASVTALTEVEEEVERMRRAFDERRKVMLGRLRALPGVRCPEARGAFYLFPDASELMRRAGIGGSMELCERWLKELRVNAIPGAACGDDRSIRLSYATSMEQIEKAMDRIEAFARPLA
jgi:aspartate aminotransferase